MNAFPALSATLSPVALPMAPPERRLIEDLHGIDIRTAPVPLDTKSRD
jgi:hypothetical protein